jgi:hypothetical protein
VHVNCGWRALGPGAELIGEGGGEERFAGGSVVPIQIIVIAKANEGVRELGKEENHQVRDRVA